MSGRQTRPSNLSSYMYFSDLSRTERTKMAAKEEVESIQEI